MFKTFAIAATALALTATGAVANGNFGHLNGLEEDSNSYDISLVRASDAGFVQIETLQGDVLGVASVNAGANSNITVPLKGGFEADVVAKLFINGQVADVERVQVR